MSFAEDTGMKNGYTYIILVPGNTLEDVEALAAHQYKEGDIKVEATVSLEGRPDTDIAVRLNGNWMNFDVPPVTLPAGSNTLYVHDTSGFYARFDAILLTQDMTYVPSENYDTLTKIAMPFKLSFDTTPAFPAYTLEQAQQTFMTKTAKPELLKL